MRELVNRAICLLAILNAGPALAQKPATGFQPDRRVRDGTRLDWEFVAGGGRLPGGYDSRRQRYQLYVPPAYDDKRAWPLIVFLSPGDDALGWRALEKPCEANEWLFASAYGAGAGRPLGQRVRATLDVLDDVRRNYRIDPDRTYLVGVAESARLGCQLAFSLPELFGGVLAGTPDVPLPIYAHLRHRLKDRLSLGLIAPVRRSGDGVGLYRDLGVRVRLWEGDPLSPEVLSQAIIWLEQDLKRRQVDSRAWPPGKSREEEATAALRRAEGGMDVLAEQWRAAALLEWLMMRHGRTTAGREARKLYDGWRTEPRRGQRLAEVLAADRRPVLRAQARSSERAGALEEARARWAEVVKLAADGEDRARAAGEVRRLDEALARLPYLGLVLSAESNRVSAVEAGSPAQRAGARVNDRVERIGEAAVTGPEDARRAAAGLRPGARVEVEVRRDGTAQVLTVTVGSRKDKSGVAKGE